MFLYWIFFYHVATTIAIHWYKSQLIGNNLVENVMLIKTTRSRIHCSVLCNKDNLCVSFQYELSTNYCTLLAVIDQIGPFASSVDRFHYRKCPDRVCQSGYDLLVRTCKCVKVYTDYRNYYDNRSACQSEGTDLPMLNTEILYTEFMNYLNTKAASRVPLNGYLSNNIPYWNNGEIVNTSKFCINTPDQLNTPEIYLYMAHSSETWCGFNTSRLDDAPYTDFSIRICMTDL